MKIEKISICPVKKQSSGIKYLFKACICLFGVGLFIGSIYMLWNYKKIILQLMEGI